MATIIKVPVRTHTSFGASIIKLQRTIEAITTCGDHDVSLDFSDTEILNPFYLGGLVCVIDKMEKLGLKITLNHNANHRIKSYLATVYFPVCFEPMSGAYNLAAFSKKTYIPIIKVPTTNQHTDELARERVLTAVTDLLQTQLSLRGNDLTPISYLISELTNNIAEHSGDNNGYIFAQYYRRSNYLDLCICDGGKGIFASYLNNPNHHPNTEVEALQFALTGRSTKNPNESRGYGIQTSRNMLINGLNGKFFMWTGNTTFMHDVNNEAIVNYPGNSFQGTYVALRIPTVIPAGFDIYDFIN